MDYLMSDSTQLKGQIISVSEMTKERAYLEAYGKAVREMHEKEESREESR